MQTRHKFGQISSLLKGAYSYYIYRALCKIIIQNSVDGGRKVYNV